MYSCYIHAGTLAARIPQVFGLSTTSSSAIIHWRVPADPHKSENYAVLYGTVNNSSQLESKTPATSANSAQLYVLQPGTVYYYRIESRNEYETVFTAVMEFKTDDSSES